MASKRITQDTFDAVVKENMDEFEMSAEEALADSIQQFESQGINLANIIKEVHIGRSKFAWISVNVILKKIPFLFFKVMEGTSKTNSLPANFPLWKKACYCEEAI